MGVTVEEVNAVWGTPEYDELLAAAGRRGKPTIAPAADIEKHLGRRANVVLTDLRDGASELAKVFVLRRAKLLEIAKLDDYSDAYRQRETGKAYDTARAEVDRLGRKYGDEHEELVGMIGKLFDAPTDPTARVAWLLEDQKAWNRARPLLEVAEDTFRTMERLIREGGAPMVRVLREELPAFFQLRAGNNADAMLKGALDLIGILEGPFLTDAQRTARLVDAELARGWYNLTVAIGQANYALDHPDYAPTMPTWDGASTFRL